jgi:hypothetical protein
MPSPKTPGPNAATDFEVVEPAQSPELQLVDLKQKVDDVINRQIEALKQVITACQPLLPTKQQKEFASTTQAGLTTLKQIRTKVLNMLHPAMCYDLLKDIVHLETRESAKGAQQHALLQGALAIIKGVVITEVPSLSHFNATIPEEEQESGYVFAINRLVDQETNPALQASLKQIMHAIFDLDSNRQQAADKQAALRKALATKMSELKQKTEDLPAYLDTFMTEVGALTTKISVLTEKEKALEQELDSSPHAKTNREIDVIRQQIQTAEEGLSATKKVETGRYRAITGMDAGYNSSNASAEIDRIYETKVVPDKEKRQASQQTITSLEERLTTVMKNFMQESSEFIEIQGKLITFKKETLDPIEDRYYNQVMPLETKIRGLQVEAGRQLKHYESSVDKHNTKAIVKSIKEIDSLFEVITQWNGLAAAAGFPTFDNTIPTGLGAASSHFDAEPPVTASAPARDLPPTYQAS